VSSVSAHGRLWLYEDVTADRDACEAIQAANRAKSQFLAMMSHELRTPMTGVLGMLDLLHLTNLVPQQQEYLKIMQESAEGLMQVINNILDFCKMEASRLLLEEIDFSLGDLFDQVASLHEKRVAEKGLKMIIQGEAGANVAVRGDPVRLRQVIVNLVSNAIKFTETGSITVTWQYIPPPPMVDPAAVASNIQESSKILNRSLVGSAPLEAELRGTKPAASGNVGVESAAEISQGSTAKDKNIWLKVKVSDTGVGIAKEQLESLFTASQPGAPRRDASGTGLGLAICKGLLALMQGRMLPPESELGKGTTVTVILPLRPAEDSSKLLLEHSSDKPVAPQQQQQPNNNSSKEQETKPHVSVLVAEDNKVNQLLIRKIFRHYGHEVELVGNGKLAVEAVQKKNYDLVLMDLQMPVLDGLSATRAIRALPLPVSKVPIYALSADALAPESGPMEETGLDGYLSKPIVWEAMSVVVEKVLASKASW
jgi:signal transduction histidine kinase/ActR/RegA family two-component response regulator